MPQVDHLGDFAVLRAEIGDLRRQLHDLAVATPLASASVERGRIRMYAGSQLLIEDGNFTVSGTATITGTLDGSGTFTWTGPVTFTGATHLQGNTDITGTLAVSGATTISNTLATTGATTIGGTLQVTGATTLKNDLIVSTGGQIKAGATIFDPSGALSSSGQLLLLGGSGIKLTGSTTVAGTLDAQSPFKNTGISSRSSSANVNVDLATFQFYIVSSASRFKLDQRKTELPDALLDVPVKDWIDRGEHERAIEAGEDPAALTRVPGVIAEEVEAAGGEMFTTYDPDGTIMGVAYDRLAIARTEILARKLDAALARIAELEAKAAS